MRIDIATLFTDMCDSVIHESIIGRGIKNGHIEIYSHDIREYTENKHRRVDDKPYGGGTGMLMQAQPVFDCISAIKSQREGKPRIIYMSPQGEVLTQKKVQELAAEPWLILLCGHYEGIDQRVLDELECEELSVGNYVLTGASFRRSSLRTPWRDCSPECSRTRTHTALRATTTDCWNIRSTRARRSGTGAESRKRCSPEITGLLQNGRTAKRYG